MPPRRDACRKMSRPAVAARASLFVVFGLLSLKPALGPGLLCRPSGVFL